MPELDTVRLPEEGSEEQDCVAPTFPAAGSG
jgi:hypothetical protein